MFGLKLLPIPQLDPDRSPEHMNTHTPATAWLFERRSTSPISSTIPTTRCHSPDPDSPEHSHYQKLPKPGHYYNLYNHEDQLTELTGATLPPLHQKEQTQPTSGVHSSPTNTHSPELESIPEEDNAAPPGGHHQPSLVIQPVAS
jgi:hypothetical protein